MQIRRHSHQSEAELEERHLLPQFFHARRSPRAPIKSFVDMPAPAELGELGLQWTTSLGGGLTEDRADFLGKLAKKSMPDIITDSQKPSGE